MIKKLFYLAFIALGVTMAVPQLRAGLSDRVRPYADDMKSRLVPRTLRVMSDQLDARLRRAEGLPGVFEGWLSRDFTGSVEDPWGNPYYLEANRRDYYVGSRGPDGQQGTADDITAPPRPLTGAGSGPPR